MTAPQPAAQDILEFWFSERARPMWFAATPEFDLEVKQRFEPLYRASKQGALNDWEQHVDGACALVILWDQFPHHMYRRDAESFAMEARALAIAHRILDQGWDQPLSPDRRNFIYLPFMHSENIADQEKSVQLFSQSGLGNGLRWAQHHRDIIRRFGRFPHRNAILGRANTPQESEYLKTEGAYRG